MRSGGAFKQAGTNAPVRRQFNPFSPEGAFQRGSGRTPHKTLFPLEPADRVLRDLRFIGQILNRNRQVGPRRPKLCRGHLLCLKTNFASCNHVRLPYISVQTQMWLQPQKRSRANKMRFIKMHFGPNPQKGKAIMKTTLFPNPDHLAASRAYHRAVNAKKLSIKYPHTAEREIGNVKFWVESAAHHRSMAAFNEVHPAPTWNFPSWRDECNWLLRSSRAAVLSEVE